MATPAIKAINKAHQAIVNRCYKHLRAYYAIVDLDGTFETDRQQAANDTKQEKKFDQYNDIYSELPKREQLNFVKCHKEIHGY